MKMPAGLYHEYPTKFAAAARPFPNLMTNRMHCKIIPNELQRLTRIERRPFALKDSSDALAGFVYSYPDHFGSHWPSPV